MGIQKNRKPTYGVDTNNASVDLSKQAAAGGLDRTLAEQDTETVDVNGDKIYVKTVLISAGPNNSLVKFAHGITNMNKLVGFEGFFDDGTFWRNINNLEATATATCHWAVDTTDILLVSGTGGDYSGYSGQATVYYTKTA
jgi:hypothetical protein